MGKFVTKEEYIILKKKLEKEQKKIVLCHGVFDLIHPGHIIHFQEAKSLGDILIVSITSQEYVRKGPGRPYFNNDMRIRFLTAIECIDYVLVSEEYTVKDIIEIVEPDLYVKGKEYENTEGDITGKITEEIELVKKHGGDIYYTSGDVFSSTKLINNALNVMTDEVKEYMVGLKKKYSFQDIKNYINKIQELKVLVIGDVIIDEYVYCQIQGLMSKDTGYSSKFQRSEKYLGGSLAIARHISSFTDNVTLMSIIGNEKEIHSRLLNELSQNIRMDLEYNDIRETIIKKRFVVENVKRKELDKIFVINNIPENVMIEGAIKESFKNKIKDKIKDFDIVVLCDFGHGLIDKETIQIIEENAKFLAINCQTNSSNLGTNLITKYNRVDVFSLDQRELNLAFANNSIEEEELLLRLSNYLKADGWLTKGAKGAEGISENNLYTCPALTLQVIDTIGAGDAFFSLASIVKKAGATIELATFLGNVAGALAANIIGNKQGIEKVNVMKYISTLMNI